MKRYGSYISVLVAAVIGLGLLALFLTNASAAQVNETGEVDLSIT